VEIVGREVELDALRAFVGEGRKGPPCWCSRGRRGSGSRPCGTLRTSDETAVACFSNANAVNQYNQTMQNVVTQHGMDLVDAAHLFAMGELVTSDAGIGCFDSKYFYLSWRPVTAIQHADLDGNPGTTADPSWQPLLSTPKYPAAHGCLTSAFTDALAAALHTRRLDVTVPGATLGGSSLATTRHYNTVDDV